MGELVVAARRAVVEFNATFEQASKLRRQIQRRWAA